MAPCRLKYDKGKHKYYLPFIIKISYNNDMSYLS
jgi:hypothetical protein